ncbi:MAG: energy-coupling factor transporter transmembrane component T [Candidatus Heimdallarchaeota archaeon]
MLRRIRQGLLYRPEAFHLHPGLGLLILVIQFTLLIRQSPLLLIILVLITFLENLLVGNLRGSLELIWGLLPLMVLLGIITLLVANIGSVITLILRLISGALIFSFFFVVTNPADLTRFLERLKIPARWAIIPSLALTLVPRIAKDTEETFEALTFRGELSGRFYRWAPRALAILVASALYRSELLAQALYYKGFGVRSRKHYRSILIRRLDLIRFGLWIFILYGAITVF